MEDGSLGSQLEKRRQRCDCYCVRSLVAGEHAHTHPQRVWGFVQKSSLSFLLAGLNADEDEANDDALDKAD